jgi:CelD/BcsL family acetyltransferase involved in cellulose biosynthesis
MYFGLYHRDRYYLLKTAYDETLRDCSPGQLLTHDALADLAARGAAEFDFLGGLMAWKADWAPAVRELCDVYVFRGAAGRALHALRFKLRPAVGKALRRLRAPQ